MTALLKLSCGLLVVAMESAMPAAAESFGTLFTTPEQRAQLDNATVPGSSSDATGDTGEQVAIENMQAIRLDGIMISSLGKKELWINGQPASAGTPPGIRRAQVGNDGLVTIHLNNAGASHSIKPGQRFLPSTGEIQEAYLSNAPQAEE